MVKSVAAIVFGRMIAKIAYSMASAENALRLIGDDGASPVVPVILGESVDIGHWVGSYADPLDAVPGVRHFVKILP